MAKKSKYGHLSREQIEARLEKLEKEGYGLKWEDKPEAVADLCDTQLPVLKEDKTKEIISDTNLPTNFIIEGDNYHSLFTLNFTHKKKIDLIYIDPPYNTGNKDFIYNDKYIDKEDTYRHSKWLSFMSKRLKLAKQLLKESGVIFISIDDNEMAQLKLLCDKIFGDNNYITTLNIQVRYADKSLNEEKPFKPLLEYVLVYARNSNKFIVNRPQIEYTSEKFIYEIIELKKGKNIIQNNHNVSVFKKGEWKIIKHNLNSNELLKETWISGSIYTTMSYGKVFQQVVEPRIIEDGLECLYKVHGRGEDGLGYRYYTGPKKANAKRGKMYSGIPTERINEMESENGAIRYLPISNLQDYSAEFGNIRHEGGIPFNNGKKPVKMLKELINMHTKKDITILDFFAGSASTAQAVLEINEDDDGSRKFIICTNNENNICDDVTYPRVKNIVLGYSKFVGIPANVKYFTQTFVNQVTSDKDKRELVNRSTELLCMAENTFDVISKRNTKNDFAIFGNSEKITAIIYDESCIEMCIEKLNKLNNGLPAIIYVFSYDHTYYTEDFINLKIKFTVKPIPEAILNVYRKIAKLRKK